MEDAELGGRSCLVGAAQDTDAGRGSEVAVEVLVSPDLRALVEPRTDAVAVVPVGQEDRGHLDLAAERFLEHGAHLLGGPRVVAGVDDDPAVRSFDREAARNAPAAHRIHAVGDLFDALGVADAPLVVGQQRGARRHRAVRPDAVSLRRDGLCQESPPGDDGACPSAAWAWFSPSRSPAPMAGID
jgi:hypothetical protein